MKFNMGCGHRKLEGDVDVDSVPSAEPDEVWDLEEFPWPWPDSGATDVRFLHSLELRFGRSGRTRFGALIGS